MSSSPGWQCERQHRLLRLLPAALTLSCVLAALLLLNLQLPLPCSVNVALKDRRSAAADGGATVERRHAAAGGASCELPDVMQPSQWAESCTLLKYACVDQGTVILYGEEHRMVPDNPDRPGTAPYLIQPVLQQKKYIFLHRDSSGRDYRYAMPPIRVRPASSTEGTSYLAQPLFSNCTVPIIWYPMWNTNLAHFFRDNAAKVWGVLRITPWARRVKWIMMTAEGHAAPQMNYDIMQPMVEQQVETWADFTNRLPAHEAAGGFVPAGQQERGIAGRSMPPLSYEGGPQRCFRRMFVCSQGINITVWPLHDLGQHLIRHYADQLQPPIAAEAASALRDEEQVGRAPQEGGTALVAALPTNSSVGGEQLLQVIFHKRTSVDRQLLNVAELVEQCNGWRHTTSDGRRLRASCREVEIGDLFTGMAVAQEANVFVGVHGANMANGWLMRPGSSMIELQPFGFDAMEAHLQYPLFNMQDNETALLWWLISTCDPEAWTPGTSEALGGTRIKGYSKFRNLIIRWDALQTVLETVVEVNGDMADYRQRWEEGRWWWFMGSGGSMRYAGHGRRTKMLCPADD